MTREATTPGFSIGDEVFVSAKSSGFGGFIGTITGLTNWGDCAYGVAVDGDPETVLCFAGKELQKIRRTKGAIPLADVAKLQSERAALVAVAEVATALLADASTVVGWIDDVRVGADYVRDLSESLDTYAATVATTGRARDGEGGTG